MEQSLTSRLNSASSHGLNPRDSQENQGTSGSQNENLGASGTSGTSGASGTQDDIPRCGRETTPQSTGATPRTTLNVVSITPENRHLIRDDLGGILITEDGTLRFTQQFLTQQQNPHIQRVKRHTITPIQTPPCINSLEGHPRPSVLKLDWTHTGEWAKIPKDRNARIHEDTPHEIVRVESYIDEDGIIKKAVCYETVDTRLKVWYRFGDIQRFYPNWDIPKPSLFYNGKKWREDTPHYLNKEKKKAKNPQAKPRSQPSTSTQGASGSQTPPSRVFTDFGKPTKPELPAYWNPPKRRVPANRVPTPQRTVP